MRIIHHSEVIFQFFQASFETKTLRKKQQLKAIK